MPFDSEWCNAAHAGLNFESSMLKLAPPFLCLRSPRRESVNSWPGLVWLNVFGRHGGYCRAHPLREQALSGHAKLDPELSREVNLDTIHDVNIAATILA